LRLIVPSGLSASDYWGRSQEAEILCICEFYADWAKKKTSLTLMPPQPEVFVWIVRDRLRPEPTPSRRQDWRIWPALFCGAQPWNVRGHFPKQSARNIENPLAILLCLSPGDLHSSDSFQARFFEEPSVPNPTPNRAFWREQAVWSVPLSQSGRRIAT
jgi:hypothetical protein